MEDYPEAVLAEAVALHRDIAELHHREQHLRERLRKLLAALPTYQLQQYVSLTAGEEAARCPACSRSGASAPGEDDAGRGP